MILTAEEARDIVYEDHDEAKVIQDEITGKGRWSILHTCIFSLKGKFYSVDYSVGATEYQEEQAFGGETKVNCQEVEAYEKTVTCYRFIKEA